MASPLVGLLVLAASLLQIVLATSVQEIFSPSDSDQYAPNLGSSKSNSNLIFTAIHSSMRQWGSSVQHNGLSLFLATVPEGTILYHGDPYAKRVQGMEWLAFEIEHAELFAYRFEFKSQYSQPDNYRTHPHEVRTLIQNIQMGKPKDGMPTKILPGYLHLYQTTRPLRLLYLDGMSASKSDLGTEDSQDFLFLGKKRHPWADYVRAADLCEKSTELGLDGIIRMEAGFEIIKCDFSDGLDFISASKRPAIADPEGRNGGFRLEYMRTVSMRYQGIDFSRVSIDYSSMIHPGFYPTNMSNPDPALSHLPRLISADPNQMDRIRSDFKDVSRMERSHPMIDWQGVVDMIVKRYSDRLQYLATYRSHEDFLSEINILLNLFIDYRNYSIAESISSCTSHYLQPVRVSTKQDVLIYAAVEAVSQRICTTLFDVREQLLENDKSKEMDDGNEAKSVELIKDLISWLDWTNWKLCRPSCAYDKVCFIAVFPYGSAEDHYHPRCKNESEIDRSSRQEENYWFPKDGFRV